MMSKGNVFDRLTKIIENISRRDGIDQNRVSTILSLVDNVREGDIPSDEKLMRYFDQLGGSQ